MCVYVCVLVRRGESNPPPRRVTVCADPRVSVRGRRGPVSVVPPLIRRGVEGHVRRHAAHGEVGLQRLEDLLQLRDLARVEGNRFGVFDGLQALQVLHGSVYAVAHVHEGGRRGG